jgi:hypothetical protein
MLRLRLILIMALMVGRRVSLVEKDTPEFF